ncbi:MAG: hypothetical protein HY835_02440 [Anaerolineae bacterium]|nr:hypothetical protein [Anaerolineae bacterium]
MSTKQRWARAGIGVLAVIVTLTVCFALVMANFPTWGATPAEVNLALPADALGDNPVVNWTNAIQIDAAPEAVWPWLAQMGEGRGGFYSFTFIENAISGRRSYVNASRILPEYQNPQPGDTLIAGIMPFTEIKTGDYIVGISTIPDITWTWVWKVIPDGAQGTRLVNRLHIAVPPQADNPVLRYFISAGAFIMEHRMLHGIKLRAEGGSEPESIELLEMALWFLPFFTGLAAAGLFVFRSQRALLTLGLGLACVVWLVLLTEVQPALALRVVIDLALIGGVAAVWAVKKA